MLHDIHLDDVTDVAFRFPGRNRSDGRHYVIDFDLAEVAELLVVERRKPGFSEPLRPSRFREQNVRFRVVTLDEEIRLISELNRTTGRSVGLYPEIKEPAWHRKHGVDLAADLLAALDRHGYASPEDPVYVQCFDPAELRRCRVELGCRLKLAQLVPDSMRLDDAAIAAVAEYADVLAPAYSMLLATAERNDDTFPRVHAAVVGAARAGLALHPYTLRRDELPAYAASLEQLLAFLFTDVGVEAVFCDHPDLAVRVRNELR